MRRDDIITVYGRRYNSGFWEGDGYLGRREERQRFLSSSVIAPLPDAVAAINRLLCVVPGGGMVITKPGI